MQLGIDYASVDSNGPPNFVAAYTAGARFAIIRRSYILHDVRHGAWHLASDPHFARDAAHARAAGLTVGAYGFFSFSRGAPSAVEQVKALLHAPGEVLQGIDLPYCVDVEFPGRGIVETGRTPAEVFAVLLAIIAEMRFRTGVSPMIYTSHGQWHDGNGLGGPASPALDGCPLWIKTPYRLRAGRAPDPIPPHPPHVGALEADPYDYWRVPTPWQRQGWWIQQYQGDAVGFPGFDHTVDLSLFSVISSSTVDGPRITWLQRRLGLLGAPLQGPLNASGIWDADTEHALKAFQTSHGMTVNGVLDVATFARLCWP